MMRNLKILGTAFAAMLALGAVAASGASAQGMLTSDGPVTLTGTEQGAQNENRFTAFGLFIQCPGSTYTGHKAEATPHELIPSGSSEVTITPAYKETTEPGGTANCDGSLASSATISMNECDYRMTINGTTGGGAATYGAVLDVDCPLGQEIEIALFTSHSHTTGELFCTIDIPAQKGLEGAHVTDNGNGTITLSGSVKNLIAERTSYGSPLLCPNQLTTAAEVDLNVLLQGHSGGGQATAIALSHG